MTAHDDSLAADMALTVTDALSSTPAGIAVMSLIVETWGPILFPPEPTFLHRLLAR